MWLSLMLKTIGIEIHEDNIKEENIPVYLVGDSTTFQISETKFL